MTEKLFDKDPRQLEFEAQVLTCEEEKGMYKILLNCTAFFPEEGGQYADRGILDGEEIQNVTIKDEKIWHWVTHPIAVGKQVHGSVDWEFRFDNMQQHSGEHIVSGLVNRRFGYSNVGFHLGLEEVTLDFDGMITWEEALEIEKDANQAVFSNFEVIISFLSPEELNVLSYRSKKELSGAVRIVEFPGYDRCACCAPHVERTGEIGLIKIISLQKFKSGVRMTIQCGSRALKNYNQNLKNVSEISTALSAKREDTAAAVLRLKEECTQLKFQVSSLLSKMVLDKIEAMPEGLDHVFLFEEELDALAMKNAVNAMTARYQGYCGIFVGTDADGYRYNLGSSTKDSREASKWLQKQLSAKGGGSAEMIQGRVQASEETIRASLEALCKEQ